MHDKCSCVAQPATCYATTSTLRYVLICVLLFLLHFLACCVCWEATSLVGVVEMPMLPPSYMISLHSIYLLPYSYHIFIRLLVMSYIDILFLTQCLLP